MDWLGLRAVLLWLLDVNIGVALILASVTIIHFGSAK